MLSDLNDRLTQATEKIRLKQKLERDLQAVEGELGEKSARLESLSAQLEKEKVDVDRLEHTSLTNLFYTVLGGREEQLEKERQELLAAQLQYQQTRYQLEALAYDQGSLSQKLGSLKGVEQAYQALLAEKEQLLLKSSQPVAHELVALSEQVASLLADIKELDEAIGAGAQAESGLERVTQSLEGAEDWGLWDLLGGGLISSAVKHGKVDEARQQISEVQVQMSRFQRELADVQRSSDLQVQISELERFADFILDGLIIDWVVQSRIVASLKRCKQTREELQQTLLELESQRKNLAAQIRQLAEKRASLIEQT